MIFILLVAIIALLGCVVMQPVIRDFQARARYRRYQAQVVENGWFDPEFNPNGSRRLSVFPQRNDGINS